MTSTHPTLPVTPYVPPLTHDLTRWANALTTGHLATLAVIGVAINRPGTDLTTHAREQVETSLTALAHLAAGAAVGEPALLRATAGHGARLITHNEPFKVQVCGWGDPLQAARAVEAHPGSLAWQWTVPVDLAAWRAAWS